MPTASRKTKFHTAACPIDDIINGCGTASSLCYLLEVGSALPEVERSNQNGEEHSDDIADSSELSGYKEATKPVAAGIEGRRLTCQIAKM